MRVVEVLTQLLDCASEAIDPPACRVFINPGGVAPFDNCSVSDDGLSNGQVWVGHTGSQAGWPGITAEALTCATMWFETYEVGVVRCAQGVIEDDGSSPDPDLVTADAQQQEEDRLALRRAIMCCLAVEGRDIVMTDGWEPVEPEGGCVGGTWSFAIRDSGCGCDQPDS